MMAPAALKASTGPAAGARIRTAPRAWRSLLRSPEFSSLVILVVIVGLFVGGNHDFLSPLNVSNLLAYLPELGIIALGMTLLMTAGEFDLSVGSVFALTPVMTALLVQDLGMDFGLALMLGIVVSIVIGFVNGVLVTKIGISSFLVTLAMQLVVRGAALYITQGFPLHSLDIESWLVDVLVGSFWVGPFRLYASLFWFLALIAVCAYLLNRAKLGNWVAAIGSNRSAAVARGVPADRVKIGLFIFTSVLSGLAGVISALRISAASPIAGSGYELEVIAMVVVGGTALAGGRGTIFGTVIGTLLLRCIRNGIVLIGVPGLAYNIFVGAIILGMLILHAVMQRNSQRQ